MVTLLLQKCGNSNRKIRVYMNRSSLTADGTAAPITLKSKDSDTTWKGLLLQRGHHIIKHVTFINAEGDDDFNNATIDYDGISDVNDGLV